MNTAIARTAGLVLPVLLALLVSACEEPALFNERAAQERQLIAAVAPAEATAIRLDLGGQAGTVYLRLGD